jgi:hypothetical protein
LFDRFATPVKSWFAGHPTRQLLAAGLFLWVVTVALHGSALNGNWRADDGDHLAFALAHEPWEYFFVPEVNRAHHGATVTPWNVFFYDVNLGLFGFEPRGHYLHMLGLVALAAWLLLPCCGSGWSGPRRWRGRRRCFSRGPPSTSRSS